MTRHQDSRLFDLVLSLDLESRMVATESAFHREVDLHHLILGPYESHSTLLWLLVTSGVHLNDGLIYKSAVARIEEVAEVLSEVVKDLVDYSSLHLWRKLLIEWECLYNQVVIVLKRFFYRLTNAEIEIGWNVKVTNGAICLLQFLNPDIKTVRLVHQHSLEVFLWCHKWRD